MQSHLGINKTVAAICGTWPLKMGNQPLLYEIIYKILYCYQIVFVFTQWMQIYFVPASNLEEIVQNISVSLIYSCAIFQLFVCKQRKAAKLVEDVYRMERDLHEEHQEQHIKIHSSYVKLNYSVNKYFLMLCATTVTLIVLVLPILDVYLNEGSQRHLPLSSWFPFDKQSHYYVACFIQVFAAYLGTCFVASTDIFFFAIMIFGIGQIKVLQQHILRFKEIAETNGDDDAELEELKVLRKCVRKHKTIIQFVKDTDELMRTIMLLNFITSSLQLATTASRVMMASLGIHLIIAVEFLTNMIVQMMLFYWIANEVRLESMKVADAIYESRWYDCGQKTKRMLHIMMMRAQRPLTISVGSFYVMSTETALAILKATYSYIALLRQTSLRNQNL